MNGEYQIQLVAGINIFIMLFLPQYFCCVNSNGIQATMFEKELRIVTFGLGNGVSNNECENMAACLNRGRQNC